MSDRNKLFFKQLNFIYASYNTTNFPALDSKAIKPIQNILIEEEKNSIIKSL